MPQTRFAADTTVTVEIDVKSVLEAVDFETAVADSVLFSRRAMEELLATSEDDTEMSISDVVIKKIELIPE